MSIGTITQTYQTPPYYTTIDSKYPPMMLNSPGFYQPVVENLKKDGIVKLPDFDADRIEMPTEFKLTWTFKPHKREQDVDVGFLVDELRPMAEAFWGGPVQHMITRVVHTFPTEGEAVGSQLWHRDQNSLGVFVYLTDVELWNGPFCYIRGSHRAKGTEWPVEKQLTLTGPRGTMFVADLHGCHRGLKPTADRYMLAMFFNI